MNSEYRLLNRISLAHQALFYTIFSTLWKIFFCVISKPNCLNPFMHMLSYVLRHLNEFYSNLQNREFLSLYIKEQFNIRSSSLAASSWVCWWMRLLTAFERWSVYMPLVRWTMHISRPWYYGDRCIPWHFVMWGTNKEQTIHFEGLPFTLQI
jgi:hypothetical protein